MVAYRRQNNGNRHCKEAGHRPPWDWPSSYRTIWVQHLKGKKLCHDDHQMETFSALLAICVGNSPVPVNSPHKGQWRGALMFSLIYAWINDWGNNHEAGDLRRQRGHYDVSVMCACFPFVVISCYYTPRFNKIERGYTGFTLSVHSHAWTAVLFQFDVVLWDISRQSNYENHYNTIKDIDPFCRKVDQNPCCHLLWL